MSRVLYASETGQGRETAVLLHGFGGHEGTWNAVRAFLPANLHILAYDLPGHGRSLGYPGSASARNAAEAVSADLAKRAISRFHLVGHSMGGAAATLMALAQPAAVGSLTLFAPGGYGEEINGHLLQRYAAAVTADELRPVATTMRGPGTPLEEASIAALADVRATPGQRGRLLDIASNMTREGRQGVIPRQQLESLAMPVAVVWGKQDNMLPVAQSNNLPPLFALHLVEAAGHMIPEEMPQLAAAIIARTAR